MCFEFLNQIGSVVILLLLVSCVCVDCSYVIAMYAFVCISIPSECVITDYNSVKYV